MQAEGRRRKQAKKSKQAGTSKQEEASKKKQASKQANKQANKQEHRKNPTSLSFFRSLCLATTTRFSQRAIVTPEQKLSKMCLLRLSTRGNHAHGLGLRQRESRPYRDLGTATSESSSPSYQRQLQRLKEAGAARGAPGSFFLLTSPLPLPHPRKRSFLF